MIRKFAAFVPVLALVGTSAVFAAQAPATDAPAKTDKKHAKKHTKKTKTTTATETTTAPAKK